MRERDALHSSKRSLVERDDQTPIPCLELSAVVELQVCREGRAPKGRARSATF